MAMTLEEINAQKAGLKEELAKKAAEMRAQAEAAGLQQQVDAMAHYQAKVMPHSMDPSLIDAVSKRAGTLPNDKLTALHELESNVLAGKGKHFSAMTDIERGNLVKYAQHQHGLDPLKNELSAVQIGQKFKGKRYNVKDVAGTFIQHTDGTVMHYLDNKTSHAIMKGANAEKYAGQTLSEAKKEIRPAWRSLSKMRSAAFTNKYAKGLGKAALYIGVPVAAISGLLYLANRDKKQYSVRDHMHDPLPQLDPLPPVMPADMGPADGRMPGEWQARVAAMRGGQQVNGPINPAQNVAEAQDLGAIPTR